MIDWSDSCLRPTVLLVQNVCKCPSIHTYSISIMQQDQAQCQDDITEGGFYFHGGHSQIHLALQNMTHQMKTA